MTLNEKLARLRKNMGLSQAEVSEKLNVSRQAVSRWEAGSSRPSTENLQSLCKLYNVSLDYLLEQSEEDLHGMPPINSDPEQTVIQEHPRKKKVKHGLLVFTIIILALLVCCALFYMIHRNRDKTYLHDLQREEIVSSELPEFSMISE